MVPNFLELSKSEHILLKSYYPTLSLRAEAFSTRFYEWISQNEGLSKITKDHSIEKMKKGISSGYKGILSLDPNWDKGLGKLSQLHQRLGLSQENLLHVYEMYYLDMVKGVESLEIKDEEKGILKNAILKRITAELFTHIQNFEMIQMELIKERENFYKTLSDISKIFVEESSHPLEDVLNEVLSVIVRDMNLKVAWIGYARQSYEHIKIIARAGEAIGYTDDLKISLNPLAPEGKGPAGISFFTGKPFILNDFDDPIFALWRERAKKFGLGSSANTSFSTSDGKKWNISLYNQEGKKFSAITEGLLSILASSMKIFIEKISRDIELNRIHELQSGLVQIQRELLKIPSFESICDFVVETVNAHTKVPHTIHISVPNGEYMKIIAVMGKNAELLSKEMKISTDPSNPKGFFSTTKAFAMAKPVIINVEDDEDYKKLLEEHPELNVKSVGSWPIFDDKEKPSAVLTIESYDDDFFGEGINKIMEQLVSSIEIAINQYRTKEKIEYMSLHDFLTDLPNRAYFQHSAMDAIKRAQREHKKVAIGFMDLDNFKEFNDTFGHFAGDELLKEVGHKLQPILRGGDVVARIGGDEFLFHITLNDISELEDVERRIRNTISNLKDQKISCSIGWSIFPDDGEQLSALINSADMDMYIQKAKNRRVSNE